MIVFGRMIHDRFERIQAMFSDISSRVQENLAGVRMIRAFVQERPNCAGLKSLNRQYIAQNISLARSRECSSRCCEAADRHHLSGRPLGRADSRC